MTILAENITVEQLRDEVTALAGRCLCDPVTELFGPLLETQERVFSRLENDPVPDHVHDLYLLAALVSAMLAKAHHDLDREHQAMSLARMGYVCADNIGHTGLRAWSRGLQSLLAYSAGRPQEAAAFADCGARIAAEQSGSVTSWLASSQARALARLGAAEPARLALVRADDMREHHVHDDLDAIGGIFLFAPARQHHYAADAYACLPGQQERAVHEATRSIALYAAATPEQRSFGDEAGARCVLALTRVWAGDTTAARDTLGPVLRLDLPRRTAEVMAGVARVGDALRDSRFADVPEARDLREQIEWFAQRPASALAS
ncbi:XRE family transcriptional regulator [Catellatospora sichuanensis]|uniref:XRE family transcriptional regulator n=1 Tax=Catellatospora sichuanensis TaxID=1969805 RepID=UPI00118220F1|nr:XRE family transcriptional regulator [Catellatospora sichuanensis]